MGKTSAILSLLEAKPSTERWAVLVNEFGEIGIDGGLYEGQHTESNGVFIKEVPGGCMCCTAGLPMQVALNQLLARAQPDRLLIEPTGLGHPKEVLQVLSAPHYHDVLNIQKTITLVDARKLRESRYTDHDTFNQQIDIADVIVGNKQDLYQVDDKARLTEYVSTKKGYLPEVVFTQQGKIAPSLLCGESAFVKPLRGSHHHHSHGKPAENINTLPIPECGFLSVQNNGEGFESIGWRFSSDKTFDRRAITSWFSGLNAERMKAVMITSEGIFGYNYADGALSEIELDDCIESRIEIISDEVDGKWEAEILGCLAQ